MATEQEIIEQYDDALVSVHNKIEGFKPVYQLSRVSAGIFFMLFIWEYFMVTFPVTLVLFAVAQCSLTFANDTQDLIDRELERLRR